MGFIVFRERPQPVMLGDYSWLCTQEINLVLRRTYEMPVIESMSPVHGMASTLPAILTLQSYNNSIHDFSSKHLDFSVTISSYIEV